jgi:hypothetical protein
LAVSEHTEVLIGDSPGESEVSVVNSMDVDEGSHSELEIMKLSSNSSVREGGEGS